MSENIFALIREQNKHAAGGLVCGEGQDSIAIGVDFGTRRAFSTDGKISNTLAKQIFFIPIGDKQAERFKRLVFAFNKLSTINRFPIYFSIEGKPSRLFKDQPCLNLDGTTFNTQDYMAEKTICLPDGTYSNDPDIINQPNLARVPANCIAVFNFVASLSGIDLSKLDKTLPETSNPKSYTELCDKIFSKGETDIYPDTDFRMRNIRLGNGFSAVGVEHTGNNTEARYLVDFACRHYGGYEGLRERFKNAQLHVKNPMPIPDYLLRELRAIEANFEDICYLK
jgi:hypothetical protein